MFFAVILLASLVCATALLLQVRSKSSSEEDNARRFRDAVRHSAAPTKPWER